MGVGSDEMAVGRAGYIAGSLWLHQTLGKVKYLKYFLKYFRDTKYFQPVQSQEVLFQLCDVMVESGRKFSRKVSSKSPLMYSYYETQYLGTAHGLTGILQQLLSVPGYFQYNPLAERDVKGAVNFLVNNQTFDGNFPCAMGDIKDPRSYR